MADDNVQLIFPIYFGNFHGEKNREKLIDKYIYLVRRGSQDYQDMGKTNKEGKLIKGAEQIPLYVGAEYYFYVSDTEIAKFHYNKLASGFYSDPVIIEDDRELNLWHGKYFMGNDTRGQPMLVRVYGQGAQKSDWPICSVQKAIFFIGRLHGNEEGAKNAIDVMEKYIQQGPTTTENYTNVSDNTNVFFLCPVHSTTDRNIQFNGKEVNPNRDFHDLDKPNDRLNETKALVSLINTFVNNYSEIIIISAHQYNSKYDRNLWREKQEHDQQGVRLKETLPRGCVMPLYNLKVQSGDMAWEINANDQREKLIPYNLFSTSEAYAKKFSEIIKFQYEQVYRVDRTHESTGKNNLSETWTEIYMHEFMYFISNEFAHIQNKKVNMIEFEIPSYLARTIKNFEWKQRFDDFVKSLLNMVNVS
jgi:hypothetical protein